jgi:hypothetical protein
MGGGRWAGEAAEGFNDIIVASVNGTQIRVGTSAAPRTVMPTTTNMLRQEGVLDVRRQTGTNTLQVIMQ